MPWHYGAERIQLERKVGMSGRNHLVIHTLFWSAYVARHASFRARQQIPGFVLPQLYRLLTRPASGSVRTKPTYCRPVAILATHSLFTLKSLRALIRGNVERVTGAAFFGLIGRRGKLQNFPDAQRNRIRKN